MAFAKRPSAKQMNRLRAWVGAADGGRRSVAIAYDSAVGYWCVIITDEQGRRFALTPDYAEADWDKLLAACGEVNLNKAGNRAARSENAHAGVTSMA